MEPKVKWFSFVLKTSVFKETALLHSNLRSQVTHGTHYSRYISNYWHRFILQCHLKLCSFKGHLNSKQQWVFHANGTCKINSSSCGNKFLKEMLSTQAHSKSSTYNNSQRYQWSLTWELEWASWCRACWGAGVCAAGGGRGIGAVRRQGKRGAVGLLERIWKRGVVWHVRVVVAQVPKLNQKAVLWVELVVTRH